MAFSDPLGHSRSPDGIGWIDRAASDYRHRSGMGTVSSSPENGHQRLRVVLDRLGHSRAGQIAFPRPPRVDQPARLGTSSGSAADLSTEWPDRCRDRRRGSDYRLGELSPWCSDRGPVGWPLFIGYTSSGGQWPTQPWSPGCSMDGGRRLSAAPCTSGCRQPSRGRGVYRPREDRCISPRSGRNQSRVATSHAGTQTLGVCCRGSFGHRLGTRMAEEAKDRSGNANGNPGTIVADSRIGSTSGSFLRRCRLCAG